MKNAIEFNHVWKKFKKGEKFNSIRDAVPNLVRSLVKRGPENAHLEGQEFWALKDVAFHVKPGEVVGVIGPNGAGKSTILKLLSQIMLPTKGDMAINGRLSALIEVTAGFHPELTGRENVYLNGTILGMKRKEIDEKFQDILDFSGLEDFIDTPVKRYSSGMFSRLGFSVAAHVDPDILLVDEVLAVGDIAFQAKCAQKMRELLKSGTTIMLVSHQLALVQSLCERVILLHKGEIKKEGPPYEVIPYYENIIFQGTEEDLKKKLQKSDYKVKVKDRTPADLDETIYVNGQGERKKVFRVHEPISLEIQYEAHKKIESPVFTVEIIRSDGVVCCCSESRKDGLKLDGIDGKGTLRVNLGDLKLTPNVYWARVTIWDKEFMHPIVIRKQDIFKIESSDEQSRINALYLPEIRWENPGETGK